MNKLKRNLIAIAFSVAIIGSVLSLSAYIGDFDHQVYVYETDSVKITIAEEYTTATIHNGDPLSYNCTVSNSGASGCYVFVEFDCTTVSSQPLFIPTAGSGWELYKEEDEVTIDSEKYYQYVFAYASEGKMTELGSGVSTAEVFKGPIDMLEMDDSVYAEIENKAFHVVARAVMVGEGNDDVDTAWDQVPKGYNP